MSPDAPAKSIRELDEQIRGGLVDYREQFDTARANDDFFRCRNRLYLERRPGEEYNDFVGRPKQFSRMTRRVVETLTSMLYQPGPERKAASPDDDAILQLVAESNALNTLMQRADQAATLNGWAAVQAVGTGQPEDPIRLYLFGPDELAVFPRSDDPLEVWAVVTKTIVPGSQPTTKRVRYEAWSDVEYCRYETKDFDPTQTQNREAWSREARPVAPATMHPYGRLPFAFCFHRFPVNQFGGEGIGDALREANQEVDRMLSDMAQLLEAYNRPQGFSRNVADSWRYSDRVGRFTKLPPASTDLVEAGMMPELFYLQPEVNVESTWSHITEFMNLTFQDMNVPLSAVRAQATSDAKSGVAILAEHAPLVGYTKARQVQWTRYERDICGMILDVYRSFYFGETTTPAPAAVDGLGPDSAGGETAPGSVPIDITWPEPALPLSSADQVNADAADLQAGLATKVQVIARRYGLTRTQAIKRLEMMAEDEAEEMRIMGGVERLKAERQMAMFGGQIGGQLQQQQGQGQAEEPEDAAEDDTEAQG